MSFNGAKHHVLIDGRVTSGVIINIAAGELVLYSPDLHIIKCWTPWYNPEPFYPYYDKNMVISEKLETTLAAGWIVIGEL